MVSAAVESQLAFVEEEHAPVQHRILHAFPGSRPHLEARDGSVEKSVVLRQADGQIVRHSYLQLREAGGLGERKDLVQLDVVLEYAVIAHVVLRLWRARMVAAGLAESSDSPGPQHASELAQHFRLVRNVMKGVEADDPI